MYINLGTFVQQDSFNLIKKVIHCYTPIFLSVLCIEIIDMGMAREIDIQGVPEKLLKRIFSKDWTIFFKTVFRSKNDKFMHLLLHFPP